MRVVLDTSVFVSDFRLKGAAFRLFLENLRTVGHSLVVPRIVFMETVNKYRERLKQTVTKLGSTTDELRHLLGRDLGLPTAVDTQAKIDELGGLYERELRSWLRERGAHIVRIPRISHEDVVKRDLMRRKPFSESGKGYRDTLIWETVLAELRKEQTPIALVSHNIKDFAGSDRTLHTDLVNDLRELGIDADHVVFFDALRAFVDAHIMKALPIPHRAFLELMADRHPLFSLESALEKELLEVLPGKELDAEDLGLRSEYETPTISMVGSPYEIQIEEERELEEEHERALRVTANVDCYFDCYIYKSDYYCLPEGESPSVEDWNESYFLAETEATVAIDAYVTFDLESGEITSFELLELSGVSRAEY